MFERLLTNLIHKTYQVVYGKSPEQKAAELARVYCQKCDKEVNPAVSFCPHCGGNQFIDGAGKETIAKLQRDRVQREWEARSELQRKEKILRDARKRCQEILAWKYCVKCHEVHEAKNSFLHLMWRFHIGIARGVCPTTCGK